ncbi:MAG: glucose-1-phosphate adenylyltransferase [Bacillati bacterium ANGP1]|uniref:Glucose-1-phosphate adenylyltransferase n=2 Tax=Candidatus Segetimicrobium genomatis TaxID=2569760 RepID=A0A537LME7_9BACT|nr:MAG: glucose-1-phosphate adenylyltransferase [Terrabacteria group bacterium ANGP1]
MARPRVLALILAGGKGERLYPLTRERGKPAVPFGGKYRIADFVLSNFVNSGIYALYVLVQYKAQSLIDHVRNAWRLGGLPDQFVLIVPPQMRWGETWYQGTADAVYQNLNLLLDFAPDLVAIFGADHIYRMDIGQMLAFHQAQRADVTVAALPVPVERASGFGVMVAEPDGRLVGFEEKPASPPPMPGDPSRALASMGNYLFTREALVDALLEDARRSTNHDFGRTILPELVPHARVYAYNFLENAVPGIQSHEEVGYWRDVGTIETYWQAHMDLLGRTPKLDLANPQWPIHTAAYRGPSARVIVGTIEDSLLGEGCIVEDAVIRRSILGRGVRVLPGAEVEESVVMDHTTIGAGARLRRVIADRFNLIPDGARIGLEPAEPRQGSADPGITVLPRGPTRAPA